MNRNTILTFSSFTAITTRILAEHSNTNLPTAIIPPTTEGKMTLLS
jgi:hypothetical protein